MENGRMLFFAAVVCLALVGDAAAVAVSALEGESITLDCVTEAAAQLEAPPGCITDDPPCWKYRLPLLYLGCDKCPKGLIESTDKYYDGKYQFVYVKKKMERTLQVTIFGMSPVDAGLYRCGLRAPSGRHISNEFNVSVIARVPREKPENPLMLGLNRSPTIHSGIIPKEVSAMQPSYVRSGISPERQTSTEVDKVIHAEEGQSITVECPLEYLEFPQPPATCYQDKNKCYNYLHPTLYIKQEQEQGSKDIITNQDYSEYERFSIKYGQRFLTVGISNLTKGQSGRFTCGVQAASGNSSSWTFEVIVSDAVKEGNRRPLLLFLIPALLLLMAVGLVVLIRCGKRKCNNDPQRAEASKDTKVVVYENIPAPAPSENIYQSLSQDTRDPNQIYSNCNTAC